MAGPAEASVSPLVKWGGWPFQPQALVPDWQTHWEEISDFRHPLSQEEPTGFLCFPRAQRCLWCGWRASLDPGCPLLWLKWEVSCWETLGLSCGSGSQSGKEVLTNGLASLPSPSPLQLLTRLGGGGRGGYEGKWWAKGERRKHPVNSRV